MTPGREYSDEDVKKQKCPQIVTKNGKEAVVIISIEEYKKLGA